MESEGRIFMEYDVVFESLPTTTEQVEKLAKEHLMKPEYIAALTVAALCCYETDKKTALSMLDFLRGPRPLSELEKQFINDRFMDGKGYIPFSYLNGTSPENNYTPSVPYTIHMADSHAQIAEEGYRIMDLKSSGADHARTVTLRQKASTGEWFLWEQNLLAGIREPKSQDPWA